jgi:hypothetical protein
MADRPSWLAALDGDDQAQFFAEMSEALETAAARRSAEPVETCLREWRVTAEALPDPAVLTGDDDDYAEVERP